MNSTDSSLAGRWTLEEHQKFLLGLQIYGKNWKKIQELISTRSCSQIRSHAQKYFLRLKKLGKDKIDYHLEIEAEPLQSEINIQKNNESQLQPEQSSYSYYLNKIVQFTKSHEQLDIWDALIDNGSIRPQVSQIESQRSQQHRTEYSDKIEKEQNFQQIKIEGLTKI